MAMMAKMRSLAPAFILSVGALFVIFMVISDSNVLEALGGRTNDVGSVNGDDISYQEFVNAVDRQVENMKSQSNNDIDEEQMSQVREQVWDAVVSQKLLEQEIEKFGITVSDDEVRDVILGDNPPDFLKQNFIDSTGKFNRQLYEAALFDPRNKEPLLQAEEIVRQSRLNEKLQSILFASITVGEADIKRNYLNQNINMVVEYGLIDLSLFPDSTVKVTDEDLKAYYEENPDKYKIEAQRKLKYILFTEKPSESDSLNVKKMLEKVASNFKSDTASFETYVEIYSTQPFKRDTLSISAFSGEAAEVLLKANPGTVTRPVTTPEGYVLYNFVKDIPSNETVVRASHILINQNGTDSADYQEAMGLYNNLISGEDFGKIAKEKSKDPGSAVKGGDLGWFTKGVMVPEFEKAAFSAEVGVVQKPVKTSFGYHLIKVTGKTNKKFIVEKIVNPVVTSASTRDAIYNEANDFAYVADKNDFEKEAELMNYKIQETPAFVKDAFSVPGLGANKRIVEFAFDNGVGTVSDVFKMTTGYAVVMVSEVVKEGIKPFDEVKATIQPLVIKEMKYKKAKELAEKIRGKIGNDLNKAAEINNKVKVDKTTSFTSAAGYIPAIGRDFAFIEKAKILELNKISEPVKGVRGYYLMKVVERTEFDSSSYAIQRNTIRDQLLNEKKTAFFNQWIAKAKKDADIVDNRQLFFGQ